MQTGCRYGYRRWLLQHQLALLLRVQPLRSGPPIAAGWRGSPLLPGHLPSKLGVLFGPPCCASAGTGTLAAQSAPAM